jgi:hypothetical protein
MTRLRRTLVGALAATAALAGSAPAASASTFAMPSFTMPSFTTPSFTTPSFPWAGFSGVGATLAGNPTNAGACASTPGPQGQGATGGTTATVCQGTGLSFVGPAVGQVATVIGPTIIGPAVIGSVIVSAGNAAG